MLYFRIVFAFEEVDFVEQASEEEQSPVGSGPNVGVVEPEPIVSSEQGTGAFKPSLSFTNSYHWY
jgi:hypothetical protein